MDERLVQVDLDPLSHRLGPNLNGAGPTSRTSKARKTRFSAALIGLVAFAMIATGLYLVIETELTAIFNLILRNSSV